MWQGGHAWQGSMHKGGACVAGEKATAADGTHPTGMNSCSILFFSYTIKEPDDGQFGAVDENGTWSGFIGLLIRKV